MITFKEYVQPETLQEALELNKKPNNILIGGMLWIKMGDRAYNKAIDLSRLGLDAIEELDDEWKIGAMVTLGQLENHEALNQEFDQTFQEAFSPIVGVQFRNSATVGGSLAGRYGFSDVLTLLMALNAEVELAEKGRIPLEEYAKMKPDRDVLAWVYIPKRNTRTSYKSVRNSATDFPVLTCAVNQDPENHAVHIVVGARPAKAAVYKDTLPADPSKEQIEALAARAADSFSYADNMRASGKYRQAMAKVLITRALKEGLNI